uniref:DUF2059 domain-containing protein n=1 Tax=Thaumasiovibrio occultus TaxID=1891184 RepID=UPI00131AF70D|nr:DUF2059 domain-containing protein [Thaumasiovibrio occultus]
MRKFRTALLAGSILCASTLFSPSLWADEYRDTAESLLDVMQFDSLFEQMIEGMIESQVQADPSLEIYEPVYRDFFNEFLEAETMREHAVDLYMEFYSQEELVALIAFYQTPVGQKTLQLMPEITARSEKITEAIIMENMPTLQKRMAEAMAGQ